VVITQADRDLAMAKYINKLAYDDEKHPHQGDCTLHGFCWIWPEAKGQFPRTARSLLGWHKIFIHGEGGPQPMEILVLVEQTMRENGDAEEADAFATGLDGYLRSQEIMALRAEDVKVIFLEDGEMDVALRLGVAERGEDTKTGSRQGVRLDYPHTMDIVMRRVSQKKPGDKLFDTTKSKYAAAWKKACRKLGLDLGPPHTVRHSGPSHDCFTGYRSMWQVQRRGPSFAMQKHILWWRRGAKFQNLDCREVALSGRAARRGESRRRNRRVD